MINKIAIVFFIACIAAGYPVRSETEAYYRDIYTQKVFNTQKGKCDGEAACFKIKIIYPEITKAGNDKIRKKINDAMLSLILSNSFVENTDIKTIKEYSQEHYKEYQIISKELQGFPQNWEIEKIGKIVFSNNNIISLSLSEYAFTGGAHPNSFVSFLNFNLRNGQELKLNDILKPGYEKFLNQLGEKKFRRQREIPVNQNLESAGFWFDNDIFKLNDNFSVTDSGLLFYFNSYEIGPYAAGPTEIEFSYREIEHLIKDKAFLRK